MEGKFYLHMWNYNEVSQSFMTRSQSEQKYHTCSQRRPKWFLCLGCLEVSNCRGPKKTFREVRWCQSCWYWFWSVCRFSKLLALLFLPYWILFFTLVVERGTSSTLTMWTMSDFKRSLGEGKGLLTIIWQIYLGRHHGFHICRRFVAHAEPTECLMVCALLLVGCDTVYVFPGRSVSLVLCLPQTLL